LVLLFQDKYGKNIEEENSLNCRTEICNALAIENTGTGSMVQDSTVQYQDGANLDVVTDVTGVEHPYELYVDKWNEGIPVDLGEVVPHKTNKLISQIQYNFSCKILIFRVIF
jgi:hypothetical protein